MAKSVFASFRFGKRRWIRIGLRTFLCLIAICCIALGWWFRPVKMQGQYGKFTEPYEHANLAMHYTARRSWNGDRYYASPVTLYYPSGVVAATSDVVGTKIMPDDSWRLWRSDIGTDFWLEDGRKLDYFEQWWFYMDLVFYPRILGNPVATEEQWRTTAKEIKTRFDPIKKRRKRPQVISVTEQ